MAADADRARPLEDYALVGDTRTAQRLVRVIRTEKGCTREDYGACAFVPLIGHYGWKGVTGDNRVVGRVAPSRSRSPT